MPGPKWASCANCGKSYPGMTTDTCSTDCTRALNAKRSTGQKHVPPPESFGRGPQRRSGGGSSKGCGAAALLPAAVAGVIALLLVACGQPQLAYACGTLDRPPVAVSNDRCDQGTAVWYSAPIRDVSEPDEQPVIGQPLDGDWWDAVDRTEGQPSVAVPPAARPSVSYAPGRPTTTKSVPPTTSRRPR